MGSPLVLVAASGLAREVLALLRLHPTYDVVGVLDDDPARAQGTVDGVPVLGDLAAVTSVPGAHLLVCAGRGVVREVLVRRLAALGVRPERYATVVHPGVELAPGCSVGRGSIVLAGTVLTAAVTVGEHVVVMPHATLTHDDVVEDYATVCAGVQLAGGVRVGRGAYLGTGATVREGVRVGPGSTLGMGAALLADLPEGQTWVGVPARALRPSGGSSGTGRTVDDEAVVDQAVDDEAVADRAAHDAVVTRTIGAGAASDEQKAGAA